MKRRWKNSVDEIGSRLERCSKLLDEEKAREGTATVDMSGGGGNHKVEQVVTADKNTIVQITVHTKPKQEQSTKSKKPEPRYMEKKRSDLSTVNNTRKPDQQPEKVRKTKSLSSHELEPTTAKRKDDKDERSLPDIIHELRQVIKTSGFKDVCEFLQEVENDQENKAPTEQPKLKKPESKPLKTSDDKLARQQQADGKRREREWLEEKTREKELIEERKLVEEKARSDEMARIKSELNRYKKEYENSQTQLKISKETNENLNLQIVEMKQMISQLTGNNRNLVQLVSDRQSQEEKLVELEGSNKVLQQQLEKDNVTINCYETKFKEQEEEIMRLKSLTADIRAQLQHGLEGLDIARPSSSLPNSLLNRTRDILGQTLYNIGANLNVVDQTTSQVKKSAKNVDASSVTSPSSDSAIDDPLTIESRSLARPVFHAPPPPPLEPPTYAETEQLRNNRVTHLTPSQHPTPSTQPPPGSGSTVDRMVRPGGIAVTRAVIQPRSPNVVARLPPPSYGHSPPTRQVSLDPVQFTPALTHLARPYTYPPGTVGSMALAQGGAGMTFKPPAAMKTSTLQKHVLNPPIVTTTQENPPNSDPTESANTVDAPVGRTNTRQTSRNLFPTPSSRSRSSTLINSILEAQQQQQAQMTGAAVNPSSSLATSLPVSGSEMEGGAAITSKKFVPAQLDLEETVSPEEVDGSGVSKSTPVTVIPADAKVSADSANFPPGGTLKNLAAGEKEALNKSGKPSLENKVQAFLDRLHQESLNYSLPQAKSFQGPSFHLCLSGEEDRETMSRETTLTERRFRRGLETSIEIIPQEFSHM